MKFDMVRLGDWFNLQKGISYTSANLVEESHIGLLTINAFITGGGYKQNSEKPFDGKIPEEYRLKDGDVLLAMTEQDKGLLASPLVVKLEETLYQSLTFSLDVARLVPKSNDFDPRFVFNILRIPAFRIRASYGDTGSTVQRLPYEALEDFMIPKPPLSTQLEVIDLMASLDQKIRVNQEASSSLEKLAHVLFKSWFIDFEPTHAKVNGETPMAMGADTAALFPESFEDSSLGMVPAGWEMKSLPELAEFLNGLALQKYPALAGDPSLPVIKIPQLKSGTVEGAGRASRTVPTKYVVQNHDVLFSWSGALEVVLWAGGEGALNQHLFKVIPKSAPSWFVYFWTLQHLPEFRLIAQSKATTMGHIQRGHLSEAHVIVPPSSIIEAASHRISPLIQKSVDLRIENGTLAALRSSLLPRLVSGDLQKTKDTLECK